MNKKMFASVVLFGLMNLFGVVFGMHKEGINDTSLVAYSITQKWASEYAIPVRLRLDDSGTKAIVQANPRFCEPDENCFLIGAQEIIDLYEGVKSESPRGVNFAVLKAENALLFKSTSREQMIFNPPLSNVMLWVDSGEVGKLKEALERRRVGVKSNLVEPVVEKQVGKNIVDFVPKPWSPPTVTVFPDKPAGIDFECCTLATRNNDRYVFIRREKNISLNGYQVHSINDKGISLTLGQVHTIRRGLDAGISSYLQVQTGEKIENIAITKIVDADAQDKTKANRKFYMACAGYTLEACCLALAGVFVLYNLKLLPNNWQHFLDGILPAIKMGRQ